MYFKRAFVSVLFLGYASLAWAQTPPASPAPAPSTAAPAGAAAVKPVPGLIGTVDVQTILRLSNAGKSLIAQADQRQKALQTEAAKSQQTIKAQQQQLLSQRASMKPEDFQKKEAELGQSYKKLQDDFDKKRDAFEASRQKALKQIYDSLSKILPEIAQQRGFNIILNKSEVVVSDERFDITDEALKRLNTTLASVKMQ